MAVQFRFEADDAVVTGYITATLRNAIQTWQHRDDYVFELHDGHLTGYPIYIRPDLYARAKSNIPKFDTLNKTAAMYASISSFANSDKLDQLPLPSRTEILNIVANNWAALCELAQNYWNGAPVTGAPSAEEIELAAWAALETKDTGQHTEEINPNRRGLYY